MRDDFIILRLAISCHCEEDYLFIKRMDPQVDAEPKMRIQLHRAFTALLPKMASRIQERRRR